MYNHNYNKIVKSDWLSTSLISALIGQFHRAPLLTLLQLVWEKTQKEYGNWYVYVFQKKSKHMTPTLHYGSVLFRYFSINDAEKQKQI